MREEDESNIRGGLTDMDLYEKPLAPCKNYSLQDLAQMSNTDILTEIKMVGYYSQNEREAFCAGVRRCAMYILGITSI